MSSRKTILVVIVSLVIVSVVIAGLYIFMNQKKSKSNGRSFESSQEEPQTEKQSTDRFHLTPEQLENMTDEELLQSVIDYPYLIDIFSTNHPEDAVASLKEKCDALKELIARGTAVETIDSYLAQHENITTAEEEILRDQLTVIRDNL